MHRSSVPLHTLSQCRLTHVHLPAHHRTYQTVCCCRPRGCAWCIRAPPRCSRCPTPTLPEPHSGAGRELPLPCLSRHRASPPPNSAHIPSRGQGVGRLVPPHTRGSVSVYRTLTRASSLIREQAASYRCPAAPAPPGRHAAHTRHSRHRILQPNQPPYGRQEANYRKVNPGDTTAPHIPSRGTGRNPGASLHARGRLSLYRSHMHITSHSGGGRELPLPCRPRPPPPPNGGHTAAIVCFNHTGRPTVDPKHTIPKMIPVTPQL